MPVIRDRCTNSEARAGRPLPMSQRGGRARSFRAGIYTTNHCLLGADDVVLLFTDGLVEVAAPDGARTTARPLLCCARANLPAVGELA